MFIRLAPFFLACLCIGPYCQPLQAAFTIQNGRIINAELVPSMSAEGHFNAGAASMEACQWPDAARHYAIVLYHYPRATCASEAYFYLALSYYQMGEYDLANENLTNYLKSSDHPKLFMETVEYKYTIAEKFRQGARRRLFGTKQLPKWANGQELALEIYDEVIAALPSHELAAKALYSKGMLLWSQRDFQQSIECFQVITRRFPKHELAPESFLVINQIYLDQCRSEFQNPDLLAFAQINVRRFQQQFPREERLVEAEKGVLAIKEAYGQGLYDTGRFYERKGQPKAAAIYYQNAVKQFPETFAAQNSMKRLAMLGFEIPSSDSADGEDCNGEDAQQP